MFNFSQYVTRWANKQIPINDAVRYGVSIAPASVQPGQWYWKVIGVHHLTPAENSSMRNLFLETVDASVSRTRSYIGWKWEGQKPTEKSNPVALDKPGNEPGGNISLDFNQTVSAWVEGALPSEAVVGVHTRHADEPGGNTVGHHSFYVVWQLTPFGVDAPVPELPAPSTAQEVLMAISRLLEAYYKA
jgi:hypothetical protein